VWRVYGRFARANVDRLLAVAERALLLFAALDNVAPGWREETCTPGGDDVNRAWLALESALGQGPDALAATAPEREGR
jgi:hypothetical protein